MTAELVEIEMAAHGVTIVEIVRDGDEWQRRARQQVQPPHQPDQHDDERSTGRRPATSACKTSADPSGNRILGTLNNCAGGVTPWGTYLTAEENFHGYFWSDHCSRAARRPKGLGGAQAASYERYGVPGLWQAWGKFIDRFNVDKEPNEPNRFGWIVEIDPFDANSVPVKHTALGRFRHEGAEASSTRTAAWSSIAATMRASNMSIASSRRGASIPTIAPRICACCRKERCRWRGSDADGSVQWLPLVFGEGQLTRGWLYGKLKSQADVLIDARHRRRPARRDAHGPARGRAAEPGHRPGLCDPHQQQGPQRAREGRRQPARR